jgi:hypothetical protein
MNCHAAGYYFDGPDPGAIIHRRDEKPLLGQNSGNCYLVYGNFFGLSHLILNPGSAFLQGVAFQARACALSLFQIFGPFSCCWLFTGYQKICECSSAFG